MTDQDKTALLSKLRAEGVQAGDAASRDSVLKEVAGFIRGTNWIADNEPIGDLISRHVLSMSRSAAPQRNAAPASFDQKARDVAYSVAFYGPLESRAQQAAQLQCAIVEAMQWAVSQHRAALASAPVAGEAKPVAWRAVWTLPTPGATAWCDARKAAPPDETELLAKGYSLELAYAAPQASEADEEDAADAWRRLALQFDGHRMQALAHLRAMLADPQAHAEQTTEFLSAPPLSGDQMLAERIRALSAQPGAQKNDIPAHLLERLRHHAADKANTAFARSTMNELAGYLSPTQPTEQGERDE